MSIALSPQAPREARHSFDRYSGQVEAALLDDLRILASEMVTNAVQHSGRPNGDPIELLTTIDPDLVRVEVVDQGEGTGSLLPRSASPPSGLQYLEQISSRWSSRINHSFHVWFEIDAVQENALIRRRILAPMEDALPGFSKLPPNRIVNQFDDDGRRALRAAITRDGVGPIEVRDGRAAHREHADVGCSSVASLPLLTTKVFDVWAGWLSSFHVLLRNSPAGRPTSAGAAPPNTTTRTATYAGRLIRRHL